MRILHVTPELPEAATRAVAHLVDEQRNFGHVVALLHLQGEAGSDAAAEAAATWDRPFDVVHAHTLRAVHAVRRTISTAARRRPLVATLHEWVGEDPRLTRADIAQALGIAGRIAVPGSTGAVRLIAQGIEPQRIRVIPYPVGPAGDPGPREQPLLREMVDWRNRGGDVLCAVAHGTGAVHHRTVLDALAVLSSREATLCLLAGDVDEGACSLHARSLGLADQVRICPPGSDARPIAARADAVILPGFDERRPFALAEVWCDGVPVLAGRNAQFTDLDAQGGGTLFYDPADPMDLARAIATVRSTTPAGRRLLVDRARVLYRLRFTGTAIVDAYMAEYQALLGPRQSVA